jgi:hypothetical protein
MIAGVQHSCALRRWWRPDGETAQLRQLTSNAPPVEPGSSLAADDDAFPLYPVSQVAWISDKIVAAAGRVHLLACRAVELYDRRRRSYTTSG